MAKSTRQYVFEGMEHMQKALLPFVMRCLETGLGTGWPQEVISRFPEWRPEGNGKFTLDTQKLLKSQLLLIFFCLRHSNGIILKLVHRNDR